MGCIGLQNLQKPLAECQRHSPRSENCDDLESNPELLDCESDALVISHLTPSPTVDSPQRGGGGDNSRGVCPGRVAAEPCGPGCVLFGCIL